MPKKKKKKGTGGGLASATSMELGNVCIAVAIANMAPAMIRNDVCFCFGVLRRSD